MSYYSVPEVTPTAEEWIADYIGAALPTIIEWHATEAAEVCMSDPGDKPHLEARTAGSISHHSFIEYKHDLA